MNIERIAKSTARVGVFGVGFDAYWPQFEGLLERLLEFHEDFKRIVAENGVEIVDFGMVDNSAKAYEAVEQMKGARLDILLCNMLTYATSSVFAPILRDANIPIVLVALQPRDRMDYTNASTRQQLENDNICSVPEFMCVAARYGKKIHDVVMGKLYGDPEAFAEIADWCAIAKVLNGFRGARFALMGHVLESMYDMHADPTAVSSAFGVHVPLLEVDDVLKVYDAVTEDEIKERSAFILSCFDTPDPVSDPLTMKLTDSDL
ncbi:MAG: arabinose isomerase, partial [Clostridiales bacterium]|nr:arabinose isomerase [Clostridiales bacterium]